MKVKIVNRLFGMVKGFKDPQINGTETSVYKSPYYLPSAMAPYNPDELVQKKGGLDVYRKMMTDDQVKAVMMMKTGMIIGTGYRIEPASEDTEDVKIAEFVRYAIGDGMDRSFRKTLKGMLSNHIYGFSISEKIFKRIEGGDYAGKIGYKAIKMRPPHSFELHSDDFGNMQKMVQSTNKGTKTFEGEDLRYFVHFPYYADNTDEGNLYGVSDLRAAYRPWWSKDMSIKFLNIFLERFGMGIVIARYSRGLGDDDLKDVDDMIDNIQARSAFRIPKDIEIEIKESARRGEAGFIDAVEKHDKSIARSCLLPDLLGFTDNKTGTYNLGENQIKMFFDFLESDRTDTAEVINAQIIRDLVDVNFMNVKNYPKFVFNPLTKKDKDKMTEQFINAATKGVVTPTEDDEQHIRESLEFPKRTEESVLLDKKEPDPNNPDDPNNNANNDDDLNPDDPNGKKNKKSVFKAQSSSMSRKPTSYEKKVNFNAVVSDMDDMEADIGEDLGKIITKMRDELTSTIVRKKIVDDRNYDEIEKLDVKFLGDLRLAWKDAFRRMFVMGKRHGLQMVNKKKEYAKVDVRWNLPPKEVLAMFERKAFTLAGEERDFILKRVKQLLYDAVKTGKSQNEAIYNIESFFEEEEVIQRAHIGNITVAAPIEEIPNRIETVIRTNFSDLYNQGLLASFQDEKLKDFIPAYQYSAIIDGRETDICHELDQKVYKADNPIWAKITPPNHFQCRSMIIPITIDEWDGKEDALPKEMPDKGFGG